MSFPKFHPFASLTQPPSDIVNLNILRPPTSLGGGGESGRNFGGDNVTPLSFHKI